MSEAASIITAIGGVLGVLATVVTAWLGYNQYTKNRSTDLKIKQLEEIDMKKNKLRADHAMIIFGELWDLLYKIGADRIYIVQPHPLGHEEMLSIYFEVKHGGVEGMRDKIQNLNISEVGSFSSELASNSFVAINDINKQIKDKFAQSLMATYGAESVFIKRLSNNEYKWNGSIFVEFLDRADISKEEAERLLKNTAIKIQYILPEIKG